MADDFNFATAGTGGDQPQGVDLSAQALTHPSFGSTYKPPPGPGPGPQYQPLPSFTPQGGGGGGRGMQDQENAIQTAAGLQGAAVAQGGQDAADAGEGINKQYATQADWDVAQQKARDTIANAYVEDHKAKLADYQSQIQDAMSTKIDPDHFWNSKSTGSQIGLAISQALGGFANGFSGGKIPNTAAQIIQSRIERDVQAQKDNAENKWKGANAKKSLIDIARDSNLDRMHEFDAAVAAGDHIASMKIEGMKASATSKQQLDAANALQQQLEGHAHELMLNQMNQVANRGMQAANLHIENYKTQLEATQAQNNQAYQMDQMRLLRQATPGGSSGGGGMGLDDATANQLRAQNPEAAKTIAHVGPNQNINVGSEDEKKEIEEQIQSSTDAADKEQSLLDIREKHGGPLGGNYEGLSLNPHADEAKEAADQAKIALAGASKYSRLNPDLIKLTSGEVPNGLSTGIFGGSERTNAALRQQIAALRNVRNSILARKGIEPDAKLKGRAIE